MITAIIGAMQIEVDALIASFNAEQNENDIYIAKKGDDTVVICKCGVGKVNSAALTQRIIDKYNPDRIINTGTAGGLAEGLNIGDIIIAEKTAYHDFTPISIVENMFGDRYIYTDKHLAEIAVSACKAEKISYRIGTVVTGDCFIETTEQREKIFATFPDALCGEMEGAAIAHVCHINKVPLAVICSVSDFAADEKVFELNAQYAADCAAKISKYIAENK